MAGILQTSQEPVNQSTPALAVDRDGTTHVVWNSSVEGETGEIYHAYYDVLCQKWVQSSAIPGAEGGFNLNLNTDVKIQGADGTLTDGIVATWIEGQGNQAEIFASIGQETSLGDYQWSEKVNLSQDNFNDDNPAVLVTADGQLLIVSPKSDVTETEADTDLYVHRSLAEQGNLTYSSVQKRPFVAGEPLPEAEIGNIFPTTQQNYTFDIGFKWKSEKQNGLTNPLPLIGKAPFQFEVDFRARGGRQFTGTKPGAQTRGEFKSAIKLFDILTLAAYVQGTATWDAPEEFPYRFDFGLLTVGGQFKLELPFLKTPLSATGGALPGNIGEASIGMVFDVRLQENLFWTNTAEDLDDSPPFFIELLGPNSTTSPPSNEDLSKLFWNIDPQKLIEAIFPSSGSENAEGIDFRRQLQLSPGIGAYGKIKLLDDFVEAKLSLIVYADFELEPDLRPLGLRERLDFEARLGYLYTRVRLEWRQYFGEEILQVSSQTVAYDPLRGSSSLYGSSPILGGAIASDLTNDGPVNLTMAADGAIYGVWVKDAPNDSQQFTNVVVAKSTDGGSTWSTPVIIPGSGGANTNPVINLDAQGRPLVVWTRGDAGTLANTPPGQAYVVFGGPSLAEKTSLDLSSLNGSDGFAAIGNILLSQIGSSVSAAGDINNDGISDFIVGAPEANVEAGRSYVVFGKKGIGEEGKLDLDSLDGSNGFILTGEAHSEAGGSVFGAGDVNGDGIADLIVGAPDFFKTMGNRDEQVGRAYIILGRDKLGEGGRIALEDSTQKGEVVLDINIPLAAVGSVTGGGDLDGDGRSDIIVGAPGITGNSGAVYVVFGSPDWKADGSRITIDLEQLAGGKGLKLVSSKVDSSGLPVTPIGGVASFIGDINQDGSGDLVVGSDGLAFVIFGGADLRNKGTFDLAELKAGSGAIVDGLESVGFAPLQVGKAGDVNHDGIADLIVGVAASNNEGGQSPGESFVIFGSKTLTDVGTLKLSQLDGKNGFKLLGAGSAVTSPGDVSGDGIDDLLIGNPTATAGTFANAGRSYLVYGSPAIGASGSIDLNKLASAQGLILNGAKAEDVSGTAVSGAGDVNQDGYTDLLIGAPQTVSQNALEQATSNTLLNYSLSTDGGTTWSNADLVNNVPKPNGGSSLSRLPDGRSLLTWVVPDGSQNNPPQDKLYSSFWDGNSWSAPTAIATANIDTGQPPKITILGDTTPAVLWTQVLPNSADPEKNNYQIYSSTYLNGAWTAPQAFAPDEAVAPTATHVAEADWQLLVQHPSGNTSRLQVTPSNVGEGETEAIVVVTRSGAIDEALTATYTTLDGSATAGADYAGQSGTLTFAPGETRQEIRVQILNDDFAERRGETFQLLISSEGNPAYRVLENWRHGGEAEITATVTLTDDEPTQLAAIGSGFILSTPSDTQTGAAVNSAGDVNNDKIADFAIAAPGRDNGRGAVYLMYGSRNIGTADQFLPVENIDGKNGTILAGTLEKGRAGTALAGVDFNGDGYSDPIVGTPGNLNNPANQAGTAYVVSGQAIAGKAKVNLDSASALAIAASGGASDGVGSSLAVGDFDGDGKADLILGALQQNKIYVILNRALQNLSGTLDLNALGERGIVLTNGGGLAGSALGTADLNGDGVTDLLIGAPQANPVQDAQGNPRGSGGQVYVVFGSKDFRPGSALDLKGLNGSNGLVLKGEGFNTPADAETNSDFAFTDFAGLSVSNAGDVNGDKIDDAIVGAPLAAPGAIPGLGRAYVVFGNSDRSYWAGTKGSLELFKLDGRQGFILNGVPDGDGTSGGTAGIAVGAGGDLNNDKIADLLVGAPTLNTGATPNSRYGQGYVVFGTRDWQKFLQNGALNLTAVEDRTRVFTLNGTVEDGQVGTSLANAGDVNGDGLPDTVIGAPYAGQTYTSFGRAWMGPGGSLDVTKLRSDNGFVFVPPASQSELGTLSAGGDINGDGYGDLLVADGGARGSGGRQIYLSFGSDPQGAQAITPSLTVTTSGIGFVAGEQTVSSGDFNGDGLADFVVSTIGSSQKRFATLVLGSKDPKIWSPQSGSVGLSELQKQAGGVSFTSETNLGTQFLNVVTGDFNGDGYDDLLANGEQSRPFVIFGKPTWKTGEVTSISVSTSFLDGKNGFSFSGPDSISKLGNLGDINGDGYEDLGIMTANTTGTIGYVVFGKAQLGSTGRVNLGFLNGKDGFKLTSPFISDHYSLSAAGDLNGDGYGDFAIASTKGFLAGSGFATVIFGRADLGSSGSFTLSLTLDGTQGFNVLRRQGMPSDQETIGHSTSAAGDLNGDGYGDLLIGAPTSIVPNTNQKGHTYVLFGRQDVGKGGRVYTDQLSKEIGFAIEGAEPYSFSGFSVAGAGDVNSDGFTDIGINARGGENPTTREVVGGKTFIPFGNNFIGQVNYLGTAEPDILKAFNKATPDHPHIMNGRQGDDVLESVGATVSAGQVSPIVMIGGEGDDILSLGSLVENREATFRWLDGGSGTDTLLLNPFLLTGNTLNLTDPKIGGHIRGIEIIDLGCKNRLDLSLASLLPLSDTTRTWTIKGEGGAIVSKGDKWTFNGQDIRDGIKYNKYTLKGATLMVQEGNQFINNISNEAASIFSVTTTSDSGAGSLRQAILDAEKSPGADVISFNLGGKIDLLSSLPAINAGNDIDFQGGLNNVTIDGKQHQILTINGAKVSFSDLAFTDGKGRGGDGTSGGGGGLGAGGALTILGGSVTLNSVTFLSNKVEGGNSSGNAGGGGNGGVHLGRSASGGGGGGNGGGFNGGIGGAGGGGGQPNTTNGNPGIPGGTKGLGDGGGAGGGGAGGEAFFGQKVLYNGSAGGIGGHGGFGAGSGGGGGGGGGGAELFITNPANRGAGGKAGNAGSFAGKGEDGVGGGRNADGGGGSRGGGGAGLGGAIFVNSGASLTLLDTSFKDNSATRGTGVNNGQGKGGGLFIRDGGVVHGENLLFTNNTASDAQGTFNNQYGFKLDTADVYGTIYALGAEPINEVFGTPGSDRLTGTEGSDRLVGLQGRDILTGGGSSDEFFYTSLVDGGDIITDFEVGSDKIVLTQVLQSLGYSGSNPIADGHLQFVGRGADTRFLLDPDGLGGSAQARDFILVQNVAVAALNNSSNFVF